MKPFWLKFKSGFQNIISPINEDMENKQYTPTGGASPQGEGTMKEQIVVRQMVNGGGEEIYATNGQDTTEQGGIYYSTLDGVTDFCREEIEESPEDFEILGDDGEDLTELQNINNLIRNRGGQ